MEDIEKKFIQLTTELYDRCIEYMNRRSLGEKTKLYYTQELDNIFKNKELTQTIYNRIYSRKSYYPSILKLITNTCEHFDIPNYNYKIIKAIKKPKKNPKSLSEADIQKLINNIEGHSLLVSCAYYIGAGLRFSSVIMLKWDDFLWEDWIGDKTKIGKCDVLAKGDKEKLLIVDPILMNKLYRIAKKRKKLFQDIPYKNSAEDLYLFIKRMDYEALQEVYKSQNFENILDSSKKQVNVKERAKIDIIKKKHDMVDYRLKKLKDLFNGKKIGFHSVRHSRATNLLKKGFKLLTIKEQLMHSSIISTEIYLNLVYGEMEDEFNEKL